jgi:pilus assembly protein CpaD
VTTGEVSPGSVRIVVSRTTASVPGCPNWEGPDRLSTTSSNYGCAMNSNLAAMIADPNDLVLGQTGSGTSDPTTASRAIRTHRNATPTGAGGLQNVRTGGQ